MDIDLKTGRHHQIRLQLAHIGAPIAWDDKYGGGSRGGQGSLLLCAYRLVFWHPTGGTQLEYTVLPRQERLREYLLP